MKSYLDAAYGIGQHLVREAIWHGDRCNWTGPILETGADPWQGATLSALRTDLYSGTSGVAYFLAELYLATGAPAIKQAALGALRQALAAPEDALGCPGMYTGSTGIAVIAAHAGVRLDQPWLVEQAARLIERPVPVDAAGARATDLMSGLAGQLLGLLILARMLARGDFVERAVMLADRLLATACATKGWLCWAPPEGASTSPLTGLSHGTAGIGQALLEVAHCTGEARYRDGGERAFAYERHLFDPVRQNWPDLRQIPKRAGRRAAPFMSTWCHGAPGIAMTRLRAFQLFADDACRDEAVRGLATTSGTLRGMLTSRTGNYSLCHGLGGNADALLLARDILDDPPAAQEALLREVAEAGLEHHLDPRRPWPCGTREGSTPGLMCGLAGIGLFYLRLHDPAVPSILLPTPGSFTSAR